ncbi:MAG: hypothetical protein ACT4O0_10870 [Pseudonocardia sp.]|jgi:transcriptional regulator with XRE-family HTH domain
MDSDPRSLRAARLSRGWSQAEAATALAALAAERGVMVAAPASLKTQLSRWENQHVVPEGHYRVLLGELYGRTEAELGILGTTASGDVDQEASLQADVASTNSVDDASLELLRTQLSATIALDDRLGATAVTDALHGQLSHLERLLTHAVDRTVRRNLAELVFGASICAGRIERDMCRAAIAWRHHERARLAAFDAGSALLRGCAMAEQAQLLVESGHDVLARDLIGQALEIAGPQAEGPTGAWLSARHGDVMAALGDRAECRSAYARARDRLRPDLRIDISIPQTLITLDTRDLLRDRGHASHLLMDQAGAIADLEEALNEGGGTIREVAGIHVDLAHAFGATERPSSARAHTTIARDITARIGSTRLAARLNSAPPSSADPTIRRR